MHQVRDRTIALVALYALSVAGAAPGCTSTPHAARLGSAKHTPRALSPLALSLKALVVRDQLEVRLGSKSSWEALEPGATVAQVVALRARGGDTMLEIGSVGRLWLAAGAKLALGQHRNADLSFQVIEGDARISLFDPAVHATLYRDGAPPVAIDDKDVLVQRATRVTETAGAAQAADWTLALIEATPPAPAGIGSLRAGSEGHLQLRSVRVEATTSGDMVETRVEHVFHNSSDQQLEGTFRFPLPEGAALVGLAMEINGKLVEGELVERNKARKVYQNIVDAMQDPALLEWEQGNIFKLRVFPIEPRSDKRVVLRYLAPLVRDDGHLSYVYETAAPALESTIPRFSVSLDGTVIFEATDFSPGQHVVGQVPDSAGRRAGREQRADGIYTALRLRPDWSKISHQVKSDKRRARDLVLVIDTSRSALESRKLGLDSAKTLLSGLRTRDRFVLLTSDLTTQAHAPTFVAATKDHIEAALTFLSGIDYDGATDLGQALKAAATRVHTARARDGFAQLVYIGDGIPTWGETGEEELIALAAKAIGDTPLHSVILGKGANTRWLKRLSATLGGRAVVPRGLRDVQRLALQLSADHLTPRLRQVHVRAGKTDDVFPRVATTLFPGDDLVVLLRTPAKAPPPKEVRLEGRVGQRGYSESFPVASVAAAQHVAHRWARYQLEQLEADKAPREVVVAHSLHYGLMSRHTAFLVLESEEAYKRFNIARKEKTVSTELRNPTVTGADLENVAGQRAGLSPDRFQPGDPEVRIPAPPDAKSVVVVFPFGETKVAHYEAALRAWTVRFLVPQNTPEGRYAITVRITHADDRVEIARLSYVIDTSAPTIKVRIRKRGAGYAIIARQQVTRHELLRSAPDEPGGATLSADSNRVATVLEDAQRVELRLPGGRVLRLRRDSAGVFSAIWRPRRDLRAPVALTFVAVDIANNKRVLTQVFDPQTGTLRPLPTHASPATRVWSNLDNVQACEPLQAGGALLATSGGLLRVDDRGRYMKLWTRVDGLPGTRVHALLLEEDTLWVGTDAGLARLSLRRSAVSASWPSSAVRAITRHRGTLYLGTWGGGLMTLRRDRLVAVATQSQPSARSLRVTALHSTGGTLYLGSSGSGLWQLGTGGLSQIAPLHNTYVWSLEHDTNGILLAGTLGGLYAVVSPNSPVGARAISSVDTRAIERLPSGQVLVGSYGSPIAALSARGEMHGTGEFVPRSIRHINAIRTGQRSVCIGTRHGAWLQRLPDGSPVPLRFAGPASNDISALLSAGDTLYVGTFDHGLSIYSRDGWHNLTGVDRRIDALAVQRAANTGTETLWVGTPRGLYRVRGTTIKRFGETDGLRHQHVHCLTPLRDGGLLVGTARGAAIVRHDRVENIDVKTGLPVASVWAVAEDADGSLWIGTTRGLYHWSRAAQRFRRYSVSGGQLNEDWVTALALHDGRVYAGSYNAGVTRLTRTTDGSWQGDHLGGGWINFAGLTIDGNTLFAASMSGLQQLDLTNASARFEPAKAPLPGHDVTALAVGPTGQWVATRRGLVQTSVRGDHHRTVGP